MKNILRLIIVVILVSQFLCLGGIAAAFAQDYNHVDFPSEYIREKDGETEILVPEAFELANILIALTDWGQEDKEGNLFTRSDYHATIIDHFSPHLNHPVFKELNKIDFSDFNNFIGFRENSFAYSFVTDSLVKSSFYDSWWGPTSVPNHFSEHLAVIENFALTSKFRQFYAKHQPYYQGQVSLLAEMADINRMRHWLEQNFPTRFNYLQVLFSPLIRGNHSSSQKHGNGFSRLAVVVAGPRIARVRTVAGGDLLLMRQIFTEIDHGYVNPLSDSYQSRIEYAFSDVRIWYGNTQGFYSRPVVNFNEYMTWGAMLLYIKDNYPAIRYGLARLETIDYMVRSRQFIAFEPFFEELEIVYDNRESGQTLGDLYPAIIEWMKSYRPVR